MCTLYENIISLCSERGIKGGKMCVDIGISKSTLTDLKAGRKKTITADTAKKIAEYFDVSVNRVLNGSFQGNMDNMLDGYRQGREDERSSRTEKAPTSEGERPITFDDFTYAMQNEAKELTEMDKQILLSMAKQLKDARNKKDGESG